MARNPKRRVTTETKRSQQTEEWYNDTVKPCLKLRKGEMKAKRCKKPKLPVKGVCHPPAWGRLLGVLFSFLATLSPHGSSHRLCRLLSGSDESPIRLKSAKGQVRIAERVFSSHRQLNLGGFSITGRAGCKGYLAQVGSWVTDDLGSCVEVKTLSVGKIVGIGLGKIYPSKAIQGQRLELGVDLKWVR